MHNMRTCSDVFEFMKTSENNLFSKAGSYLDSLSGSCSMGDGDINMVSMVLACYAFDHLY